MFKLKDVYAPFLWNLAVGIIGIIPEGSGTDFSRHLIGSGPFKLARYIQDQEIVLERNDSYFGKQAGVSTLRFRIIPEQVVVALELRKGTLDIALNVLAPDMVEVLKHDPKLNVAQAPGTNYQYLAFNLTDPAFRDVRVRQAFAYGIDRQQIVKYLWRGQARPAVGLLPPNNWAYNGDVRTYPYDPQRAKPKVDELIEFARREIDIEKRKRAYHEIQRIAAEELPYVSLFYLDNVCVYSNRIEGIKLYPAADLDFLAGIRIGPSN